MNWGYRIAILIFSFIAFMLFMVYQCMQQDFDLVAEDYYVQELAYQDKINQQENTNNLVQKPTFELKKDGLFLNFYKAISSGTIYVFRPSDDELDFEEVLILDQNFRQKIDISKFEKGVYRLKINWEGDDEKYYIEKNILIP